MSYRRSYLLALSCSGVALFLLQHREDVGAAPPITPREAGVRLLESFYKAARTGDVAGTAALACLTPTWAELRDAVEKGGAAEGLDRLVDELSAEKLGGKTVATFRDSSITTTDRDCTKKSAFRRWPDLPQYCLIPAGWAGSDPPRMMFVRRTDGSYCIAGFDDLERTAAGPDTLEAALKAMRKAAVGAKPKSVFFGAPLGTASPPATAAPATTAPATAAPHAPAKAPVRDGPGPASVSVAMVDGELRVTLAGLPAISEDGKLVAVGLEEEVPSGATNLRVYVLDADKGVATTDMKLLTPEESTDAMAPGSAATPKALEKKVAPRLAKANAVLAKSSWIPLRAAARDGHGFSLEALRFDLAGNAITATGGPDSIKKKLKWPKDPDPGCRGPAVLSAVYVGGKPRTALVIVSFELTDDACGSESVPFVLRIPEAVPKAALGPAAVSEGAPVLVPLKGPPATAGPRVAWGAGRFAVVWTSRRPTLDDVVFTTVTAAGSVLVPAGAVFSVPTKPDTYTDVGVAWVHNALRAMVFHTFSETVKGFESKKALVWWANASAEGKVPALNKHLLGIDVEAFESLEWEVPTALGDEVIVPVLDSAFDVGGGVCRALLLRVAAATARSSVSPAECDADPGTILTVGPDAKRVRVKLPKGAIASGSAAVAGGFLLAYSKKGGLFLQGLDVAGKVSGKPTKLPAPPVSKKFRSAAVGFAARSRDVYAVAHTVEGGLSLYVAGPGGGVRHFLPSATSPVELAAGDGAFAVAWRTSSGEVRMAVVPAPFIAPMTLGGGITVAPEVLSAGRDAYLRHCSACHGPAGDGKGPAASGYIPPPRAFTKAVFKFGSVRAGELPTDDDLRRMIKGTVHDPATLAPAGSATGPAGTAASVRDVSDPELDAVIQYIKVLATKDPATGKSVWETSSPGAPIIPPPDPWGEARRAEAVARGKAIYHGYSQCWACHPAYATKKEIYDATLEKRGAKMVSADFRPDLYGSIRKYAEGYGVDLVVTDFLIHKVRSASSRPPESPADYFRIIAAGIGGTAQPAWIDSLSTAFTAGDLWAMAYYVQWLVSIKGTPESDDLRRKLAAAPSFPPPTEAPKPPKPGPGRARAEEEYKRGLSLSALGRDAAATEAFQNAIEIDPDFADAHRALGMMFGRSGESASMCKELKTYVKLAPSALDSDKIRRLIAKYEGTVPECRGSPLVPRP